MDSHYVEIVDFLKEFFPDQTQSPEFAKLSGNLTTTVKALAQTPVDKGKEDVCFSIAGR